MRPTLSQCFPNPLTRQWPSTTNPVSCECQQLYALVCICCCLPKTHLLVLHEGESNNMVTSMPKGPKYVEYQVTPRTTAEDLSSFLYRAELAAAQAQQHQQQQQQQLDAPSEGGGGGAEEPLFSPMSPFSAGGPETLTRARRPSWSMSSVVAAGTSSAAPHVPSSPSHALGANGYASGGAAAGGGGGGRRQVVVVCLHGIAVASPAVRSVLMDVLTFAQVPSNRGAKSIPSLRIVAFCDYRACAAVLPETLRAGFALSTFMSGLSMDSAVVLQSTDPRASSVVNKAYMLEVMNSADGLPLVDTVVLSAAVARYLRHLMMTVQGSTLCELAPGALLPRRTTAFYQLLKMAAVLFMPDEELFTRRVNPRTGLRGGGSSAWGDTGGFGVPQMSSFITSRQASGQNGGGAAAPSGSLSAAAGTAFAANKDGSGRLLSFSHVVVSASDVICLMPAIVAHHLTLPRAVVDVESRMMATRAAMAGLGGPLLADMASRLERAHTFVQEASGGSSNFTHRRGVANAFCEEGTAGCPQPGLWDARMASLALARRPHTSAVAATAASRARRHQCEAPSDMLHNTNNSGGPTADGGSAPPTVSNTVRRGESGQPQPTPAPARRPTSPTPRARANQSLAQGRQARAAAGGRSSSPLSSPLGDTWRVEEERGVLANMHTDESEFLHHDYLTYCELREVLRCTLVCRTLPAPA